MELESFGAYFTWSSWRAEEVRCAENIAEPQKSTGVVVTQVEEATCG